MRAPAVIVMEPVEPLSADTTLALVAAGTEMVTVPAPTPTEAIPAPLNCKAFENVPVLDEVVFPIADIEIEEVWIAGDGTEMVTEPLPTPTDAIPAPEKLSRPENVPAELDVVLPSAVKDWLIVCTDAEIVMVLAPFPIPIPAPAKIDTLEEVPFSAKFVAAGTAGPEMVMTCNDCDSVMLLPPTRVKPPDVIFEVAPAVLPLETCNELRTVELFVA